MLDYPRIDPRDIIIRRTTRQRQENIADVDDLQQSIAAIGIINPIVIRTTDEGPVLVAGERRLRASLALGLEEVPIRSFETLTEEEAEEIELEENAKRKDLSWRDQVRATGRLHELYKRRTPGWKIEQTAGRVSLSHSYLRRLLHVYAALDSGRIAKADSVEQAYNTLHRFSERKAESIVSDLIVKGSAIFGEAAATATNPAEPFTTLNAVAIAPDDDDLIGEDEVDDPSLADDIAGEVLDASALDEIIEPPPPPTVVKPIPTPTPPSDPVICANFAEWIKTYTGPKFSLIHCDFPYGTYRGGDSQGALGALDTEEFYANTPDVYWNLMDALTSNIDKIMSYSAHMVFWFDMSFYAETVARFRKVGLMVHDHPLVWHKSGGPGGLGVAPGTAATHPRRTYDTALFAVRGNRPLVRSMCNSYAAPTAGNKIHPSQKPEPMLRYFLQMVVDETTTMFDPTCGSAAALRAAEDLGARSVLGLELDPNYARDANTRTLQARKLRMVGGLRRDDTL